MATLIKTDGTRVEVEPKNGSHFEFKGEVYDLLGCSMVEVVHLADGRLMLIDEEGKFDSSKQPNWDATKHLVTAGGIPGDYIVGDALVIDSEQLR